MASDDILAQLEAEADIVDIQEQILRCRADYQVSSPQTAFNLAYCLTKSNCEQDLREGIQYFQELIDQDMYKTDCLYLIALAHYRLADYAKSRDALKQLLCICPTHERGLRLQGLVKEKATKDGLLGFAIFAGAAVLAMTFRALSRNR